MSKLLLLIFLITVFSTVEGAKAKVRFRHYPDGKDHEYPMFDADTEKTDDKSKTKKELSSLEKMIIDNIIHNLLERKIKDSLLNSWIKSVKKISPDHDLCVSGKFNVTLTDVCIKYQLEQIIDISGFAETNVKKISKDLNVNSIITRKENKKYTVRNQKLDSPGPLIEMDLQNNTFYLNNLNLAITYLGMTAIIRSVKLTFSIKGKGTSRWYNYSPSPENTRNSDKPEDDNEKDDESEDDEDDADVNVSKNSDSTQSKD